ncbi:FTR1 family iron permease [Virgibacillus siamensis]|uniref:FTR1 family iron permease n=1 Tax=Virgibacillus siamensis TaxID=480071 RepID=UPI001FE6FB36|nr:FTR1 family protein [Virgibacillus siamensis]
MKWNKTKWLISMIVFLVAISGIFINQSKVVAAGKLDALYIQIGDAMMNAKDMNWQAVDQNITSFSNLWKNTNKKNHATADDVTKQLEIITANLENKEKSAKKIRAHLSALSQSLNAFKNKTKPAGDKGQHKSIKQLLPYLDTIEKHVKSGEMTKAAKGYDEFVTAWTEKEVIVRNESITSYGAIETQMGFLRIALSQEPPDIKGAKEGITKLRTAIQDFLKGKRAAGTGDQKHSLTDAVQLLNDSAGAMADGKSEKSADYLKQLLVIWPSVEGKVRTSDPALYSEIENNVPKTISILKSENADLEKAEGIITDLEKRLQLITGDTEYTFVDALLILFREGMEAILIIAGLLAFLKKTNNERKKGWIWGGASAGLIASAMMAICINLFFSNVTAAASREYLEGIIGLTAVFMMLTVGVWLHKKTNINHWNQYIEQTMCKALAKGSLVSIAVLSFLSIFREGAETIIFYAGMAPSIKLSQLILGIGIALVILFILGFFIIRYSAKIPVRKFFLVATVLIYFLAFKMVGVSIHALQVANSLPIHYIQQIPFFEFIGLYPTVETIVPQMILLLAIAGTALYVRRSGNLKAANAISST